ncbi:Transcriptional regulatory protein QseB [compost metagenome]
MKIASLQADPTLAIRIEQALRLDGHQCRRYLSGRTLLGALHAEPFDLLILDCEAPGIPALDVLAWVRRSLGHDLPVMLTGGSNEEDFVAACFAQGADSYLPGPPRLGELAARVQALLRRARPSTQACDVAHGAFRFAPSERRAWVHGRPVPLAPKEFDLAVLLFRNLGSVVPRQAMVDQVWRHHIEPTSRTVDSHLSRVRTKLSLWPHNGVRLSSVYGLGCRLDTA